MPDAAWLNNRIDEIADELGKLRLLTTNTQFEYRTERICQCTFTILASLRETAGDRVRNGMDVEEALKETDAETRRLNAMLRL